MLYLFSQSNFDETGWWFLQPSRVVKQATLLHLLPLSSPPVHDAAAHQGLQEHEGRVHDGVRENKRQHAVRAVSQGTHTSHHHANKRILTTRHPVIDGPHSIIKFTGGLVVCFIWYFVSKGPANRSIGLEQALLTQK